MNLGWKRPWIRRSSHAAYKRQSDSHHLYHTTHVLHRLNFCLLLPSLKLYSLCPKFLTLLMLLIERGLSRKLLGYIRIGPLRKVAT